MHTEDTIVNDKQPDMQAILRRTLLILVPAALLMAAILIFIYQIDYQTSLEAIQSQESNRIELLSGFIADEFQTIAGDLMITAQSNDLRALLDADTPAHRQALAETFWLLSNHSQRYDQIRYLDETGMEIVRVNFNQGTPDVVADDALQDKGERYYFRDAFELDRGQIFVSPFDLNIEQGQIEQPLKPMIRFGTPVFDAAGEKRGIVLLNYFGADMLQKLELSSEDADVQIMLLNTEGYWLKGQSPEQEWGFMYDDRLDMRFDVVYPDAWTAIQDVDSGQSIYEAGLFTHQVIFPLLATWQSSTGSSEAYATSEAPLSADDYCWKLISLVPDSALTAQALGNINTVILTGLMLFILITAVLFTLARLQIKRELAEQQIELQRNALARQNINLEQTNHDLDAARIQAETANHLKSEFLAKVTHELRTPLNAVLNFTDFVREGVAGEVNEEQAEMLDKVMFNSQHLLSLINDLLDISKIEAGELKLLIEDNIDLTTEVQAVGDVAETILGDKPVDLITDVSSDVPTITGDRRRIHQVMLNLVSNACKFTDEGRVWITLKRDDEFVVFSVGDTGPGIAPEDQDLVFASFGQTDVGKVHSGSTGLGLPISRSLVEAHGGTLDLESEVHKGSTFTVRLPIQPEMLADHVRLTRKRQTA